MSIHSKPHGQAGQTVTLKDGTEYRVEDWWDRVAGKSWMFCHENPACWNYAVRSSEVGTPIDNEVLYGKIGFSGVLVHVSEIREDECS